MLRILQISLLIFLLSSCGYTFVGSGSILPPDIKKVYVPIVENNSTETSLTQSFTEALRDQFDRYGAVIVVDSLADADAVLTAKVVKVTRGVRSSSSGTDSTLERNTSMEVAADLKRINGSLLWRNKGFSVSQRSGTTTGSIVTSSAGFAGGTLNAGDLGGLDPRELGRGQEQEAFNQMAEDAAKSIYDAAVAPDF